ncbi:unnamed protein product, partial [Sphacelaria rigidula]
VCDCGAIVDSRLLVPSSTVRPAIAVAATLPVAASSASGSSSNVGQGTGLRDVGMGAASVGEGRADESASRGIGHAESDVEAVGNTSMKPAAVVGGQGVPGAGRSSPVPEGAVAPEALLALQKQV